MNNWQAQNTTSADYIGILELETGEYFEVVKTDTHLVFGNCTNTGLLESGNFLLDDSFSLDENLQELNSDLECFYRGETTSDNFACNKRM